MLAVPRILRWGWQAEYFGVPLLYVGSVALLGFVPCLCIVMYAKLHIVTRLAVFLVWIALHVAWSHRFTALYKKIFNNAELRACIYQEESDEVYYLQRGDNYLTEKKYKFKQFPPGWQFIGCLLLSFLLAPFSSVASSVIGVPFAHLFLCIGGLPVSLMCVGLAVRGGLIFFFYPMKIKRETGKRVYVDMTGRPDRALQGNRKTA
jgi:hypothetical protein